MILKELQLINFRPYQDTSMSFGGDKGHIHIIEGPQGAGKTSLKEAIRWALYGAPPSVNYRRNWNRSARDQGDERMEVELGFTHRNRKYELIRSIQRFDHKKEQAHEELQLVEKGVGVKTGSGAQSRIGDILPETLDKFYFLDGERIQRYFRGDENIANKVVKEIETVLNHKPILNAETDLRDKLEQYKEIRHGIEKEVSERDTLTSEIKQIRAEKRDLENELENKKEAREELRTELDTVRQEAAEENQAIVDQIEELDSEIEQVRRTKNELFSELRESIRRYYNTEVKEQVEQERNNLQNELDNIEEELQKANKHKIIHQLVATAKEDVCPICGSTEFKGPTIESEDHISSNKFDELESKKSRLERYRRNLQATDPTRRQPSEIQSEIEKTQSKLKEIEQQRSSKLNDLSRVESVEEHNQISEEIEHLEQSIEEITKDIGRIESDIESLQQEIQQKEDKREAKYEDEELIKIREKIQVAEKSISKFEKIRRIHKEQKQDDIRDAMSDVFDQVTKSEFVKTKYSGLDFKGDVGEDEAFMIELVRQDGKRKDMKNHQPSAGESQLAALSFVFGLNRYATYDATIVFDTVAGRLDQSNAQAEGEFFAELDRPILLLLTDAELEFLEKPMREHIGSHHQIRIDSNMNSIAERLN